MGTNQTASFAATTNALRDIKPPLDIPSGWLWLWLALAVLVILAGLFALWKYWPKRGSQLRALPPVPAHVRARQKLREALAWIGEPKPFCTLVSDTIRLYLEERFDFHAPERTTEEFLYELQGTHLLSAGQKESLGEFLQRCDLVKFAKYEPGEPELRDLHGSAGRLIDETEPQPVPTAANGPPSPANSPAETAEPESEVANRKS